MAKWHQPLSVVRIPDKPTAADLDALGQGCDTADESRYGLLVLDELGAWLNAREWADKQRQGVIDWLIHSRKKRWDVIFIVQHVNLLDKQVREALLEYQVICKRLDKVRVPLVGWLGMLLTFGAWDGRIGKVHLGVVIYVGGSASPAHALVVDRWLYRGTDLYAAYDTEQQFSSSYTHGLFTYLTPWHVKGRYSSPAPPWWRRVWNLVTGRREPRRLEKPAQLRPLLAYEPELRWFIARQLVQRGRL